MTERTSTRGPELRSRAQNRSVLSRSSMVTSPGVTAGSGATTTSAPLVSYTFTGTRCGRIVASAAAVASETSRWVGRSVPIRAPYRCRRRCNGGAARKTVVQ